MPMELQIIRASDFIRLGAEGQFDLAVSKKVLAELVGACRKRGINQAMLDLRALHPGPTPVFSPTDLAHLVNTFREMGFTRHQKLAVLYGTDPHHRARLFAFIGTLRGWHVAAFGSFEEAMGWLSDDEQASADVQPQTGAEAVPLKVRDSAAGRAKPRTKIRPKR
jgi:hypothetical protein